MKARSKSHEPKDVFAQNVKKIRVSGGYTQVDFAKKLGLGQAELSQIESAKRGFSNESLAAISKALGCEPWELLKPAADFIPTWSEEADLGRSVSLSHSAIQGDLSAKECALILGTLADCEPSIRAVALALLFRQPALARGVKLNASALEILRDLKVV